MKRNICSYFRAAYFVQRKNHNRIIFSYVQQAHLAGAANVFGDHIVEWMMTNEIDRKNDGHSDIDTSDRYSFTSDTSREDLMAPPKAAKTTNKKASVPKQPIQNLHSSAPIPKKSISSATIPKKVVPTLDVQNDSSVQKAIPQTTSLSTDTIQLCAIQHKSKGKAAAEEWHTKRSATSTTFGTYFCIYKSPDN
jgi:hypothetical protein